MLLLSRFSALLMTALAGAASAAAPDPDFFADPPPVVVVYAGKLRPDVARLAERAARDFGPAVYLRLRKGISGYTDEFFETLARTYGGGGPFEVLIAVGEAQPRLYLVDDDKGPVSVQKLVLPTEAEALTVRYRLPGGVSRKAEGRRF